jgi:hypothetical protein
VPTHSELLYEFLKGHTCEPMDHGQYGGTYGALVVEDRDRYTFASWHWGVLFGTARGLRPG